MASDFASHRDQVERLLQLAGEYGLSELDRDRLYETTQGHPTARFEDPRARDLADRLNGLLKAAASELSSDEEDALRQLIAERLRGSF